MKSAAAALVDPSLAPSAGAQKPELIVEAVTNGRSHSLIIGAFLMALAFAGLLQSRPAAAQQATASASQATTTAGQETKSSVEEDLATIIQSRSTNTLGYRVGIHNDGGATVVTIGATYAMVAKREYAPGTVDTKTLRRLLTAIGDVSRIPTGKCMKSVSFGTTTQIAYGGKTSGDLQCVRQQASGGDQALQQASEDLARFVLTSLSLLKVNTRPVSSNN